MYKNIIIVMIVKPHPKLENVFVSDTGIVFERVDKARLIKYPVCIVSSVHVDVYGYFIASFRKCNEKLHGYKDYKRKKYKVHQLVAQTFILNPQNYLFIDHLDGNKQNNNVSNLKWVTRAENNKTEARKTPKYSEKTIYSVLVTWLTENKSVKEISKEYKVTTNTLKDWFKARTQKKVWLSILNDYRKGNLPPTVNENRVEYILSKMETAGES